MQVLIIGSVNFDRIITFDGKETSSPGGILYNVLPLASLMDAESTIRPVLRVGEDHWSEVCSLVRDFANVDLSAGKINPAGSNENLLVYRTETEREERLQMRLVPLEYGQVKSYLDSDVILINLVTGNEIRLDLLKRLRHESDALIYLDVHSRVLGIREDGSRYPAGWEDWREWFRYVDVVQMNVQECGLLLGKQPHDLAELRSAAAEISTTGPAQVVITLGVEGAFIYVREDEKSERVPSAADRVVDTTGCGDCFAAGYIWGFSRYGDPVRAACAGNVVAGENCGVMGLVGQLDRTRIEERADSLYQRMVERRNQ